MNRIKVLLKFVITVLMINSSSIAQTWEQHAPLPAPMIVNTVLLDGKIYAVGTAPSSSPAMYIYDPILNTWTKKAQLPSFAGTGFLVEVNRRIFSIGGTGSNNTSLKTVAEYDLANNIWINKSSAPYAIDDVGIVVLDGKIYIIGGIERSNNTAIKTLQVYNPQDDSWQVKADMIKPRIGPAVVCINGKIYSIDGWTVAGSVSAGGIEEYDVNTDKWTEKAAYTVSNSSHCQAVAMNGKIYSMADFYISEYDPALNTWTQKFKRTRIDFFTKFVLNNKLYMFGGFAGGMTKKALRYDPVTNTQISLPDISEAKCEARAVELNGKIYLVGGTADWVSRHYNRVESIDTASITSVGYESNIVNDFSLSQNYPNPFNPETIISYRLPVISFVTLKVYDMLGREIITLVNEVQTAGNFDAKFSANNLSSGIYLYKLNAGDYSEIKKMTLIR